MNGLLNFPTMPRAASYAATVGKKEKKGPMGSYFIDWNNDTTFGCESWEKSETALQQRVFSNALEHGGIAPEQLGGIFGGDLQAQCTATHYAQRSSGAPFFGLYGACSTMALSLICAAAFVDSRRSSYAAAVTSSHFCAAERQFRFPLEYGGQRTPTAQWTVTGAGCVVVGQSGAVKIANAFAGRIVDYGVTDINNMGAAMAPAAADSFLRYFRATGTKPDDYDAIFTGDLGSVGSELFVKLLERDGVFVENHLDCGTMIYDLENDDVGAGGSGCGCSASVLCAYLLPKLEKQGGNVLFASTGALMSPITFLQKESIPAIAHIVNLTA